MSVHLLRVTFCFALSILALAPLGAQTTAQEIRNAVAQAAGGTKLEILPPDHPLTQDVPFIVTVLADVPSVIRALEEKTEDGVAAQGFAELDSWDGAIHFHESGSHLGTDATCPLAKGKPHATNGVRLIGPTRFGLYGSRLRTSVAWQATMVLTRSGPYSIEVIPFYSSGKVKSEVLRVAAESHWPASLTRALLLAMLVIVAAVLLVTPARVIPLLIIGIATAWMAWYAVPSIGNPYELRWRQAAAGLPLILIVIGKLSGKPLLDLLLPVRQSGAVKPPQRVRERRRNLPEKVKRQAEAAPQNPSPAVAEDAPHAAPESADAGTEGEAQKTTWLRRLSARMQRVRGIARTFVVWLRGPVTEEDLPTTQSDEQLAEPTERIRAAVAALEDATRRRSLPKSEALGTFKAVADGVVLAVEHRAKWQLVIGGACGLAAVVFLLRVSVMFGDAAITAPRSEESLMPFVVRLLPYLLCFVSLILAAGFLMRQYRASLDDFRHFIRNQRLRESQVAAFEAAQYISNDDDVARKTIEILAWGEASGTKGESAPRDSSGGAGTSTPATVE